MSSHPVPRAVATIIGQAIAPHDTPERRAQYLAGDFPRADAVKDLDKRYRWDLYWLVRPSLAVQVTDILGWSLDSHIDTVLRRSVPKLPVLTWDDADAATYTAEVAEVNGYVATVCLDDEGPLRPAFYWTVDKGDRTVTGWAGSVTQARRDALAQALTA